MCVVQQANAQCTQLPILNLSPQPNRCQTAVNSGNIVPLFNQCRTVCMDNTNAGPSNQVNDHRCTGGVQPANDLFLYANNPYAQIPGYDGSLVFRWVDWPGKANGVLPPYFAVHGEVRATLAGITVQSIDCTDGFALENAICLDTVEGNQFYTPAGTIPTLAQLEPIVDAIAGVNVTVADVSFWINIATSNGATGPICFEASPYKSGYICGDATTINLTGSGATRTGTSAATCLCGSALYGGLGNTNNNLPVPCGMESASSAWFKINVPFGCNNITASLSNWGGSDAYNIAILSGVDCPGNSGTNPITGAPTFIPGQTLEPGAAIVGSACNGPASTACSPVPAGEYYIVVSGKSERPTFTLSVNVTDVAPSVGTATSQQNNTSVCSGSSVTVGTTGTVLPNSASCGQNIAWFYSNSLTFNPYTGGGTYAGSGTSNVTFALPANTGCTPRIYYIKGVISDNGTTAVAGCKGTTNTITVTVYPEIGNVTVQNNPCLISVATRCPSFTVNGTPGVSNFIANFSDDGSTQNFIISNGLAACNQVVQEIVSCSGNCTPPTVSANDTCDPNDPFNFYVDVNFAPGSAATYFINDNTGGAVAVSNAGRYRVGPFSNGSTVSISVDNPDDANCNRPLGTFTSDCNTIVCPNLVSAVTTVNGDVCEGQQTILQATVDRGVINVDYSVQWYMNGVPIPNGNSLAVIQTFSTTQGCSPEAQEYTVALKCLRSGGRPTLTNFLSAGTLVVYPKPDLGQDFVQNPQVCVVAPVDNCGGLNISYSPVTNPGPGTSSTQVTYTAFVTGAPTGCSATGTYQVSCPSCTNRAGEGVNTTPNTYCDGEQFSITSTGSSLGAGYTQLWGVTTNDPYNNLGSAVLSAFAANSYFGDSSGTGSFTFTNGTQYGPGEYFFIPFVAMQAINASTPAYQTNGSISLPFSFTGSSGSATITIPQVPYCSGLTVFDMTLTASKSGSTLNPIDRVTGLLTYSGGATASLNLNRNNYTANPSGQTITIEASAGAFLSGTVTYDFTLRYQTSIPFGTVCPTCNDVGAPVAVNLLPAITLSPVTPAPICIGEVIDLNNYLPTANTNGSFTWYDGDPATGGQLIARPDSVSPVNGSQYFVQFLSSADTTCSANSSITFSTVTPPSLNPIPAQPDLCLGETVDLTQLEQGITTDAGTFTWYKGDPANFGVRLPNAFATNLSPISGQAYYAVFQDALTGCTEKVSVTYTVKPLPSLTALPPRSICTGATYDLTSQESNITSATGTFEWYDGDPNNGGTLLTPTQAASVQPDTGSLYVAVFTDATTGCSARTNVTFNVNPLPVLNTPTPSAICSGSVVDLTALQSSITSAPGVFAWYDANPQTGGQALAQPEAYTLNSQTTFYVSFTNSITSCNSSTSFTYNVIPSPVLNPVPQQTICSGESVSLIDLQQNITLATGFFTWYLGDPDSGGVQLTPSQAANQTPTGTETYYLEFLAFPSACTAELSFSYIVNSSPVLNPIPNPGLLCAGQSVDLSSYQTAVTSAAGTFKWYLGNPTSGGTQVTGGLLTNLVPADNSTYYVQFTDANTGCVALENTTFDVAAPVTGGTASYDCNLNQLVVNLSNASGGSGAGYTVAPNSPNTNGQTLANGTTWRVYYVDDIGCADTLSGNANCLVCSAGAGVALANNALCCDDTINITTNGVAIGGNNTIAWAFGPQPVTNLAGAQAANNAGNLFLANPDNSIDFSKNCSNAIAGTYYLTPMIVQSPVIDSVLYDTLNGCKPYIEICPTVTGTGWSLDPLILVFPDGSQFNVNDSLAFGLPLTEQLLAAFGGLPCIKLNDIYPGDPNGTWSVIINNTGTGAVTFGVPAFNIVVADSSCTLLNGQDQVTTISAVSGTINGGTQQQINIAIPPLPANFPSVDTACSDFGTPVEIVLLDPITADTAFATCTDSSAGLYTITIGGLQGGAPDVISGEQYAFPAAATYNSSEDTYSFDVTVNSFPYSFTISNNFNTAGGDKCPASLQIAEDVCVTGIKEIALAALNIYPNPSSGIFNIEGALRQTSNVSISVTNMLGEEIYSREARMEKGKMKTSIDLSQAAVGVYFVTIKTEKQTITKRIAKQ
ncbi:MAG: T9SS type A sorting domain-containing protein [Chitinophagales bacterium]|nr:T9SS type A sorting domain-containing protein [Chitinophagales bacterium]